ncbi:MAG: sirohydrochlorin cobaltochelatase [Acidobacteriota bacterium]|jgi:sirohydrochlorin cobaltochelatase|nr:sirohydrochlorin cobaltochelatase [Acidobacteriota bacterium]
MDDKLEAILVAAFGTTVAEAREAYSRFDRATRARFEGREVRWAYTSAQVRRKLARQEIIKESVGEALAGLAKDGYRKITVLPLQVIPGVETDLVLQDIASFSGADEAGGVRIAAGKPLLSGYDDALRVARALLADVPKEREQSDALIFMGHGSAHHAADLFYVALNSILRDIDGRAFLGTVEGHPTLDDVVSLCRQAGCARVWLIPFMAVAGDHVVNDMAGDEEDSWKSVLKKAGIESTPMLRGMLDNPGIRDVWLDHLAAALER